MIAFFRDRPWLWIILAFLVLITGWVFLIRLSLDKAPQPIPLPTPANHSRP